MDPKKQQHAVQKTKQEADGDNAEQPKDENMDKKPDLVDEYERFLEDRQHGDYIEH